MNIDKKALKGVVDEIEASRARQKGETEFQREALKAAVKNHKLDAKAIRIVLQRRAMGDQKRDEQDYYVHSYELALGGKKAAMDALEQGATVREAAAAGGISTGAAGNLAKIVQNSSSVDSATATQLRALIPTSTDPGRLEREAAALEGNEIHRGATQPKGCAKVVRTDASMSESVAASGDAVRDASAMPLDVVAAPHSEGREHAGSAATAPPACVSGTHSGGDAQDESCGESVSAVGATATPDAPGSATAPLRPHDTPSGGSSTGRTSPFQGEDAGSSPVPRSNNTAIDTRGEARPSLEDAESTWFSTLQRSRQEGRV